MTSKKKRKYGDLTDQAASNNDPEIFADVFAAFTGRRPPMRVPETAADNETDQTSPAQRATPAHHAAPARSAANKVNTQKESTQTQAGVGGGSRFSLNECRKYAEHLRSTGQGINNPGGYATTILRTGEADDAIAAFLMPEENAAPIDVSGCPDCSGTGFWYPNGLEKGVTRCTHARLIKDE